ncbi:SDR family NAD(P)-dependent oxidoreductase [Parahaliea sp. F7430]|uniref:SDR family NAD(P)-dependent oxidoreductase n=1 Tax=Sediminihaliea albiluteola TaxID=2758564 RepID=A0A7W2TTS8_9GAMM|nr:SDR family NAD(P)-dependent oxidoreductase [Sediminihaliea albiluteola]MBA6411718.1 SDR family NAD(P)-dependent oxidoreductase [Sediminihaliea albiluteola]
MTDWTGRVCVITGAGSGIGAGLARHALQRGMKVVCGDIDEAGLQDLAKHAAKTKGQLSTRVLDVSDADAVADFAEWVYAEHGKVHLLFNNAGVLVDGKCWERPLQDWRWIIDVNLMGVVHGLHHFVPRMLQQGEPARVINTASIGGLLGGGTFMGPYQSVKHAVVALTESLYRELAQEPGEVKASVLCPSEVDTGIWRSERLRPAEQQVKLGESEQQFHEALANHIAAGLSPDEFAVLVFKGIEAGQFWLIPDTAFMPLLKMRYEEIEQQDLPATETKIDFE